MSSHESSSRPMRSCQSRTSAHLSGASLGVHDLSSQKAR